MTHIQLNLPDELAWKLRTKCANYKPRKPQRQYILELLTRDLENWETPQQRSRNHDLYP